MDSPRFVLFISLLFCSLHSFEQSSKRIKNNLTVDLHGFFDKTVTISFDRKNPNKHGWDYVTKKFEKSFSGKGFKIAAKNGSSHHYTFVMDYEYGYLIAAYKMQYTNLVGSIVDDSSSAIIGTFSYSGRYENDDVSEAIAIRLNEIIKSQVPLASTNPGQSKEKRLTELKDLFDKGLINSDDYEKQKDKILNDKN